MDPHSLDHVDDKVLKIEANEVIKEVSYAVSQVELSPKLASSDDCIYMNVETKEQETFCIELSLQGFRIVGRQFDEIQESVMSTYYETIYALLDSISPEYRNSFGNALMSKLATLEKTEDEVV